MYNSGKDFYPQYRIKVVQDFTSQFNADEQSWSYWLWERANLHYSWIWAHSYISTIITISLYLPFNFVTTITLHNPIPNPAFVYLTGCASNPYHQVLIIIISMYMAIGHVYVTFIIINIIYTSHIYWATVVMICNYMHSVI